MPKRETNKSNQPSPVHMMKLDQSGESSESNQSNFIACINGYLNQLDYHRGLKACRDNDEIAELKRKIKKEKSTNKNLQKEFFRVTENTLASRRIESKENDKSIINQNSHAKSPRKLPRKTEIEEISISFDSLQSECSSGENEQYSKNRYDRRWKTEMPYEIERAISKTMVLMPGHRYRRREVSEEKLDIVYLAFVYFGMK